MKKKKKAPSGMMSHHAWESTYFGSHQQSMQANGYTIRWLLTCLAPLFNLIMHMLDNFTLFNPAWNYWFTECGHGGFIPVHYLPACTEVQMGLGLQIASSHGCDCGVWILSIVPFLHPLVSEQVCIANQGFWYSWLLCNQLIFITYCESWKTFKHIASKSLSSDQNKEGRGRSSWEKWGRWEGCDRGEVNQGL